MSTQRRPRPATSTAASAANETPGDVRTSRVDFLLFLLLPMSAIGFFGFPVPELAMGVAVLVALHRRPRLPRLPGWLVPLLVLLVGWMSVVALAHGLTPVRRLAHLALFAALVVMIGQGRFAMRSVAQGIGVGLLVAGGAGLVGVGVGTGYTGRLTGFLGDPNLAGYYFLTLGAFSAAHLAHDRWRRLFLVVVTVLIVLTLSRTSLLAAGLVASWVLMGQRLRPMANLALLVSELVVVSQLIDRLRLAGPFAERAGSDLLRQRIVALEHLQVDKSPWFGHGPGTSQVLVGDSPFFFHNSYLALQNEGGVVAVAIMVVLGCTALLTLSRLPRSHRNLWLEGGLIAVATCAINLGEVLLELPAAVALGAAVLHLGQHRAAAIGRAGHGAPGPPAARS